MTLSKQFHMVFVKAPLSLKHMKKKSLLWMSIYFISGFTIFSLFTWQLLEHQDTIKKAFLNYFFPESWHYISEKLAQYLFESQAKIVIANMIIGGSLVIASLCLFQIKENLSHAFEKDINIINKASKEFPLFIQAWEEIKLLLIYLTAQSIILWIGYYPYAITKNLSIVLSYFFLFFTFGIDFIAPTFQRHRFNYNLIIKFLLKKLVITLSFGFLFSLPVVLLSQWLFTMENLTLITISGILFLANLLFLTLAVPLGTFIASQLYPDIQNTQPPKKLTHKIAWFSTLVLLTISSYLHIQLIKSLHYKSQILKAEYTPHWSSIDYTLPTLTQVMSGKLIGNFSIDMTIKNPTEYPISIENSQFIIKKSNNKIAFVKLNEFKVNAHEEKSIHLQFESIANLPSLPDFKELKLEDLDITNVNFEEISKNWRIDLYVDIWPGIPFILNIVD